MRRSADHATFTIERRYAAPPAEVFAAWATPELKRRWFACHDDWTTVDYRLDFRVGGDEINRVAPPGGEIHGYAARYLDIVENARLVYAYTMHLGARLISISLATVTFEPDRSGALMTFTEQTAFLDGYDGSDRQHGTEIGLERLERLLTSML